MPGGTPCRLAHLCPITPTVRSDTRARLRRLFNIRRAPRRRVYFYQRLVRLLKTGERRCYACFFRHLDFRRSLLTFVSLRRECSCIGLLEMPNSPSVVQPTPFWTGQQDSVQGIRSPTY